MHFKKDVLSQFRKVRSYERIDLLCSLLDLCLPFELRFLGTCLEFLGKRDFNELREDERLANNVTHIAQFRSLCDENTRRKLVLYVSLLKSCNSDCASCFNDTLVALCLNGFAQSCRTDPENAAKALDELLLLYTIALNHPAFTIHQKSEFASVLARLQDEDQRLSAALCSANDLAIKSTEFCVLPETPVNPHCMPKSPPFGSAEGLIDNSSSQVSVKSLASPLTCHVLPAPGSTYTIDALSPTLSQASTASLGPPQVSSVSGVCHTTTTPPVQSQAKTLLPDGGIGIGGESGPSCAPVPMALPVPVSSSLVMGPGPNMMVPLASTSSHCIMSSPSLPPGDLNLQKGSIGPHPLMPSCQMIGMPPDSVIHMPYPGPGPSPWNMMMHVPGHMTPSGPVISGLTCTSSAHMTSGSSSPTAQGLLCASASCGTIGSIPSNSTSIALEIKPSVVAGSPVLPADLVPASVPVTSIPVSSPCTTTTASSSGSTVVPSTSSPICSSELPRTSSPTCTEKEISTISDDASVQCNLPSLASNTAPSKVLPQTHNSQPSVKLESPALSQHESPQHQPHPPLQPVSLCLSQRNASPHHPVNSPSQPYLQPLQSPQHVQQQSPSPPQVAQPQCQVPPWETQWNGSLGEHLGPDHLKEAIGREMPKYQASLQDFSPDELLHMSDEQLKDIGLSPSAIQQLRSIMGKLQAVNGISCIGRIEPLLPNEAVDSRRRYQLMDGHMMMGLRPMMPPPHASPGYGFMFPFAHPGNVNATCSNGGSYSKGNRQHHHIMHQMRGLRLDDEGRRPCSNSSSTSDCSSGSHSPPETPSLPPHLTTLPHNHHWDRGTWPSSNMHSRRVHDHHGRRGSDHFQNFTHSVHSLQGYSGKDSGGDSWNSGASDDRNREDRLHEPDERSRPNYQPPNLQRSTINSRPRGLSKAPPGIPTIPRGRGHHLMDKCRRDGPGGPINGVPPVEVSSAPSPFPMSGGPTGVPTNVPYTSPVNSFLPPAPFPAMHAFHRYQPGTYLHPAGTSYAFPPNGEMWNQYPQPPHQNPQFIAPVAFSPAHPPPKLSCYNCGGQGHQGGDCKESTFEEITQQGQYHLDYKPYKESSDCRDSDK